jgi:anti-sigma factor ChrR (cupin superfamily)
MSVPFDKSPCEYVELVAAHAIGALPAEELPALEAHLVGCAECRQEFATLGTIVRSFAAWPTDILRPSRSMWGRLAQRIGAKSEDGSVLPRVPQRSQPMWEAVAPGLSCKLLAADVANDRVSMLVRLAPGASYPAHTHAGVEELHLLAGELWIDDRKLLPGDYNRAEMGTADKRVWSQTGCTCVLITSTRDVLTGDSAHPL